MVNRAVFTRGTHNTAISKSRSGINNQIGAIHTAVSSSCLVEVRESPERRKDNSKVWEIWNLKPIPISK